MVASVNFGTGSDFSNPVLKHELREAILISSSVPVYTYVDVQDYWEMLSWNVYICYSEATILYSVALWIQIIQLLIRYY